MNHRKELRDYQLRGYRVQLEYHKTKVLELEQRIKELERHNLVDEAWKVRTENDPLR